MVGGERNSVGIPWVEPDRRLPGRLMGQSLPALVLPTASGSTVDLAALTGTTVLVIFPWTGRPGAPNPPHWDDIPGAHGSTPQLEAFRDWHPRYRDADITVVALSSQPADYQAEMVQRLGLRFPVLSDHGFALAEALGLERFSTGGIDYHQRITLVTEGRRIARVFYPILEPAENARAVWAMLAGAKA